MSNMTGTRKRYTVRKMSSGYTASVKWYVYDNQRKGRVSVHAHIARESAQHEADSLNVSAMVKDHADDPRPYAERLAEAEQAFRTQAQQ